MKSYKYSKMQKSSQHIPNLRKTQTSCYYPEQNAFK